MANINVSNEYFVVEYNFGVNDEQKNKNKIENFVQLKVLAPARHDKAPPGLVRSSSKS